MLIHTFSAKYTLAGCYSTKHTIEHQRNYIVLSANVNKIYLNNLTLQKKNKRRRILPSENKEHLQAYLYPNNNTFMFNGNILQIKKIINRLRCVIISVIMLYVTLVIQNRNNNKNGFRLKIIYFKGFRTKINLFYRRMMVYK